jgi:hypothetical protein
MHSHKLTIDRLRRTPNFAVMPRGTKVVSAESWGVSTWTKTAKVSVILSDGNLKRYFLKVEPTFVLFN